jgi:bacterioferritin-associated ferredoxin
VPRLRLAPVWVCLCQGVTSRSIMEAVDAGATTVKEISEINGAGTVCGKCTRNIRVLIEQHRGETPPEQRGWRWRRIGMS